TVPLTLPQASTDLHVRVSEAVPALRPRDVTSLTRCTVADEQASEAVGAVKLGTEGQEMVALIPWPPIVGGVLSITVIDIGRASCREREESTALHVLVSVKVPAQDP